MPSGVLKLQWPSNSSHSLPEHAWEQLHRVPLRIAVACATSCHGGICESGERRMSTATQGNYATQDSSGMCHFMPRRHLPDWRQENEHRTCLRTATQGNYATQDSSAMCHFMPRRHLPDWRQENEHRTCLRTATQGNYATQDSSGMCHFMPRWHLPEWREENELAFVHHGISGLNHAITSNRVCHKTFKGVVRHFIATSCKCNWQWLA